MRNWWFIILLSIFPLFVKSNVVEYISGDISCKKITGVNCNFSMSYEITVSLTTGSVLPGNSITVDFGDGISGSLPLINVSSVGNHLYKSTYRITHIYSSCFAYIISFYDTNNVQAANNIIGNCKNFYIQTELVIVNISPNKNSSINAGYSGTHVFKNKTFNYNSAEIYTNNFPTDSTIYTLVNWNTSSNNCLKAPMGLKFNKYSGEFIWTNPDSLGKYMFHIEGKSYKDGMMRVAKSHAFAVRVLNQTPAFQFTHSVIPLNTGGFKEFSFMPNTTYSFSSQYTDNSADSVRLFVYSLDFYNTAIQYTYTSNSTKNHSVKIDWTPQSTDIRDYPYNVVVNARSYYPNDSVANSYQTVSYKYANSVIGIKETISEKGMIQIFPNPAKNELTLIHSSSQYYTIQLVDVSGRILKTINATENKVNINVSDLASGVYFVKTKSNTGQSFDKLVIE